MANSACDVTIPRAASSPSKKTSHDGIPIAIVDESAGGSDEIGEFLSILESADATFQ
jgi:hypothetical protein